MYYNCRCNIEATRLSMLNWARDRGWVNYFMKRPRKTYPEEKTKASNTYGTPATVAIIEHQTDLIKDYVEDYCDQIWFPEFLEQLNRYSNENKGKFDIVAAMGMWELADEELAGVTPTVVAPEDKSFKLLGWYTDEKGYKHFGVIPESTVETSKSKYKNLYMTTVTELEQVIRDCITDVYNKQYVGTLEIKRINPIGLQVRLGMNNYDKPINITAELRR